jgi:hypothetical protein
MYFKFLCHFISLIMTPQLTELTDTRLITVPYHVYQIYHVLFSWYIYSLSEEM